MYIMLPKDSIHFVSLVYFTKILSCYSIKFLVQAGKINSIIHVFIISPELPYYRKLTLHEINANFENSR